MIARGGSVCWIPRILNTKPENAAHKEEIVGERGRDLKKHTEVKQI